MLLAYFGEQGLYRQGLKIRTTIDKPLQDGLIASLTTGRDSAGEIPDRIMVMKEGSEIRALSCSGSEDQARIYPGSLETPNPSYEIMMADPASIKKEEILLLEPRTAPAVSTDPTASASRSD